MPTYEYVCRECAEHLEVVQSFTDDPLTTCGRCGGDLRKVFSAAGIIFKGSGYYVTDSRKPSGDDATGGDAAAASATDKGASPKTSDDSGAKSA